MSDKIYQYPLKVTTELMADLKDLAPKYGHGSLASFIRWILINFVKEGKKEV